MYLSHVLKKVVSYQHLLEIIEPKTQTEQQKLFEIFIFYLFNTADYSHLELEGYWLYEDIPEYIFKKLNIRKKNKQFNILIKTNDSFCPIKCEMKMLGGAIDLETIKNIENFVEFTKNNDNFSQAFYFTNLYHSNNEVYLEELDKVSVIFGSYFEKISHTFYKNLQLVTSNNMYVDNYNPQILQNILDKIKTLSNELSPDKVKCLTYVHQQICANDMTKKKILLHDPMKNVISVVGKGSYGTVFMTLVAGKKYACKIIHPNKFNIQNVEFLVREINMLAKMEQILSVDYFPAFYGIFFPRDNDNESPDLRLNKHKDKKTELQSPDHLGINGIYIVTEYIDGCDFFDFLSDICYLEDIIDILLDVAKGLSFLSDNSLVHGDIKPENIMIYLDESKEMYRGKLIDFGVMHRIDDQTPCYGGTLGYFKKSGKREHRDMYAFGQIIFDIFIYQKNDSCFITDPHLRKFLAKNIKVPNDVLKDNNIKISSHICCEKNFDENIQNIILELCCIGAKCCRAELSWDEICTIIEEKQLLLASRNRKRGSGENNSNIRNNKIDASARGMRSYTF